MLLAHAASAEQADTAAPVRDALPAESGNAPVSAASATPPPPTSSWVEPADEPSAPPPAPSPREHWYGWQLLMSDATSMTLALATQESWLAASGYLLAPPLIHVFHGQGTRALASAGMRIGLPLLGYAIAVEGSRGCSGSDTTACDVGMVAMGLLVGISAVGIDAALAYEPVKPSERSSLVPQILVSDREARFGVAGSF